MKHTEAHPLAGKTVTIKDGVFAGQPYWIEDWWDKLTGGSWMDANGNPACMEYAMRALSGEMNPIDDDVVYGKIGRLGKLMHVSRLGEEVST